LQNFLDLRLQFTYWCAALFDWFGECSAYRHQ
jgi:hypothetical protein